MCDIYREKGLTWNLYIDDSHGKHRYYMILGHDILSGLKIDLFLSYNKIRGNGSAYEGYTIPMKEASKMNFNVSSNWI